MSQDSEHREGILTHHTHFYPFSPPEKVKKKQFRPCYRHLLPLMNLWIHWGLSAEKGMYHWVEGKFFRQAEESHVGACLYCECKGMAIILWFSGGIKWCSDLRCLDAFVEGKKTLDMCPFLLLPNAGMQAFVGGPKHFCLLESYSLPAFYCFHIKNEFYAVRKRLRTPVHVPISSSNWWQREIN